MSDEFDDYYFDDVPLEQEEKHSLLQRAPLKLKLASLALISILGYSMIGSTFSSNIGLGTGRVEFGQGAIQATSCDGNITVTPFATFSNATGASAKYKLTTLKVEDVGAGCWGKDLMLRLFDSTTATPLTLYQTGGATTYDYIRVFDDNGVFNLQSAGLVSADISQITNGFQVNLYNNATTPSVAQTLATSVYKVSLESLTHDSSLTLVNLPSGSLNFSNTGGYGIAYNSNSAFALGTGAFTIDVWAKIPQNAGSGFTFFDAGGDVNTTSGFAFWIESGLLKIRRNFGSSDIGVTLDNTTAFRSQWHHYAAVRNTTTSKFQIFLDGNLVVEGSDLSVNITVNNPVVGQLRTYPGYGVQGEIRNLRLVKGTALYSGSTVNQNYFTPQAAPLDKVSGTTLLLLAQNSGNPTYDSSDNHWTPANTFTLPTYLAP